MQKLLGILDEQLGTVTRELHLIGLVEGLSVNLTGEEKDVDLGVEVLESLLTLIENGEEIDKTRILYCIELAREGRASDIAKGKQIKCKTV